MYIYHIKVKEKGLVAKAGQIKNELNKLHAVQFAEVDVERTVVRIVLNENECIRSCKTILEGFGFPEINSISPQRRHKNADNGKGAVPC